MDKHELIVAVKQLADELGSTPHRTQFIKHVKCCQAHMERNGIKYSELLEIAGLTPVRKEKVTNAVFRVDIERHLENYVPKQMPERKPWPKIAVLGDLHEPFGSERVKAAFISFCQKHQPEYVVQVGDALDMYSHSRFPKSHNVFTPEDEEIQGRKKLEELWTNVRRVCPNAKCVQLLGNHDVRPIKGVITHMPSIEHWAKKYLKDLLTFDGVETIIDPREEYVIADIAFLHGHLSKLGAHRDFMLMNAVRGHDHHGGAVFRKIHDRTLWELDAGFAGDIQSKGFTYTNQKMTTQTEGFGWIDEYGPRFIPC